MKLPMTLFTLSMIFAATLAVASSGSGKTPEGSEESIHLEGTEAATGAETAKEKDEAGEKRLKAILSHGNAKVKQENH